MSITHKTPVDPIKVTLYIVFFIVTLTLGYAAFQSSTEFRSKAASNCKKGELAITKCIRYGTRKNKKGEEKRYCAEKKTTCVSKRIRQEPSGTTLQEE